MLAKTVTKWMGTKKAHYKSHKEKNLLLWHWYGKKSVFRFNLGRLADADEDLRCDFLKGSRPCFESYDDFTGSKSGLASSC